MELIKIFIDFYFYLLRSLTFSSTSRFGKRKMRERSEGKVKKKIANEMKCHLSILFQFLIKIFLGRDMMLEKYIGGMMVWQMKSCRIKCCCGRVKFFRKIMAGFECRFYLINCMILCRVLI